MQADHDAGAGADPSAGHRVIDFLISQATLHLDLYVLIATLGGLGYVKLERHAAASRIALAEMAQKVNLLWEWFESRRADGIRLEDAHNERRDRKGIDKRQG